ncbi:hypothetical protein FOTG_17808 [Fusarium oxysporum f. sp. vasinfectum 25433]|uniref:Uncharacterized protein n=1 Tax=Fusarium oxysporum f. sp. vasinfectum 25433 TaxID=1089449 RepID=X0LXF1_FUSOX|nr:hypothetical protein FOTG_18389 [Fusarium oxysporum f. sp. vasinfectum 25433]EXM13756.1 hypothetical protein FOTG_17808 [Fusarium oxysporum f. sp. vasinfectum 25433]
MRPPEPLLELYEKHNRLRLPHPWKSDAPWQHQRPDAENKAGSSAITPSTSRVCRGDLGSPGQGTDRKRHPRVRWCRVCQSRDWQRRPRFRTG